MASKSERSRHRRLWRGDEQPQNIFKPSIVRPHVDGSRLAALVAFLSDLAFKCSRGVIEAGSDGIKRGVAARSIYMGLISNVERTFTIRRMNLKVWNIGLTID